MSKLEGDQINVEALGNGRYQVSSGGVQQIAAAVAAGGGVWVFLDGATYLVCGVAHAPGRRAGSSDDADALSAPMPATVVLVNVEPGDQVAKGDVVVILEAMKMELPIKAPRQATVKAVRCRQGELVRPGVPLLELE